MNSLWCVVLVLTLTLPWELEALIRDYPLSELRAHLNSRIKRDDSDSTTDEIPYEQCPKERRLCRLENGRQKYYDCDQQKQFGELDLLYCDATSCQPEEFQHDYIVRNHDQTPHVNQWKRARVGENATLHDVCILRNGMPVTRRCEKVGYRAKWEVIDKWQPVVCLRRFRERTISVQLNSLHDDILEGRRRANDTQGRQQMAATMRDLFRQPDKSVLPADVHMTGQVLGALMEQEKDAAVSADLVSVYKEIMSTDREVLRLSAQLNATNSLLTQFENYMDGLATQMVSRERCGKVVTQAQAASDAAEVAARGVETVNFSDIGVQALLSSNLSVFFVSPECDKITGIAIYSANSVGRKSSSDFWYRFLRSSDSLDSLKRESDLEVATFLPKQLWEKVNKLGATYLVFKIYAHDALFVEMSLTRSRRPRSKVISISIPEIRGESYPPREPALPAAQ
ncbi:uncharacterized protein LOC117897812 isoform X2 [Drosophila subobscura]|uniref:uncharacterized protein LOC117897812 isoform X2 n=1 Tax=Drosophila subobscura TaxID=7241 RepID=UPI00155A808B|nr:uncharacterized protein LOC117897812 isoform X2 [Drosophila subobscura]